MPWVREMYKEPPTNEQMNGWEKLGYGQIQIVGPCPVFEKTTGQQVPVYVVYRHRSIIMASEAQQYGKVN